jgi:hypothetical protein
MTTVCRWKNENLGQLFRSLIVSVHNAVGTPHDEAFAVIRDRHPGAARSQYGNLLLNLIPRRLYCRASLRVQRKRNLRHSGRMTLENLSQNFWEKTHECMGPKGPAYPTPIPLPGAGAGTGGIAAWTNEARRGSRCRRSTRS